MAHHAAADDPVTLQGLLATIHLPSMLDHACLDPLKSSSALREQAEAAKFWDCAGFCVPSGWVKRVRSYLPPNGPKLVAVVGFPTGAVPVSVKLAEAEWVAEAGADELDVVPDFAALADGNTEQVYGELAAIVQLGLPGESDHGGRPSARPSAGDPGGGVRGCRGQVAQERHRLWARGDP